MTHSSAADSGLSLRAEGSRQGTLGIEGLLDRVRSTLHRLTPLEVWDAVMAGGLLVDTRTESQRRLQGELRGSVVIDRTVLEWRLDPASPNRIPESVDYDRLIIVVCRQGFSSSLAAASLQSIGLRQATDMIGGVEGWIEAGLPMSTGPADVRL
jgi:rhodanese-related sulfurtransferase